MAARTTSSPAPVLIAGFVLFVIVCVLAYAAFGPDGEESGTTGSGAPAYPGEPVSGEPVTTASGLRYYELKVGDGRTPGPANEKDSPSGQEHGMAGRTSRTKRTGRQPRPAAQGQHP